MNLAQSVQDFVQAGRSLFAAFKWLLLLTGSRAPVSGLERCVVRTLLLVFPFVFFAPRLPVAIPNFGCAWVAGVATGQPTVLARAKAGHKAC